LFFLSAIKIHRICKEDIVVIICTYQGTSNTVRGKIKNGRLYTDDAEEKSNEKLAGKYYLLSKDRIRILNTENGDYLEYDTCK